MGAGKGIFKSTMGYSFVIFLSRILGLFREILCAHILGGGLVMSAWSTAFLLPNLFRRILGEGALGTALIPLISHTLKLEGQEAARRKFSTILIWLTFLLAAITVAVSVPAILIEPHVTVTRWKLMLLATPVVMPYCVLICLIGIITSLLNSLRSFVLPALASLLLNVCLIAALALGAAGFCRGSALDFLRMLGIAVLISGALELVVLGGLLKKFGMVPEFSRGTLFNFSAISEILKLALPGLVGMSALQISVLCDRTIAMSIDNNAAAALTYSDRLIYLPIGIFAVAFGTVSLSVMSEAAAAKKLKSMLMMLFSSMRQLLFITIPLAVYMLFFGRNLLDILFRRGAFDETALNASAYALFCVRHSGIRGDEGDCFGLLFAQTDENARLCFHCLHCAECHSESFAHAPDASGRNCACNGGDGVSEQFYSALHFAARPRTHAAEKHGSSVRADRCGFRDRRIRRLVCVSRILQNCAAGADPETWRRVVPGKRRVRCSVCASRIPVPHPGGNSRGSYSEAEVFEAFLKNAVFILY